MAEGEILLKSFYVSVGSDLCGRMICSSVSVNEPLESIIVAEVMESNNEFQTGEYVSGMPKWKEYQTQRKGLNKVDKNQTPLSPYLECLVSIRINRISGAG